jgi:hypothetical protein
LLRLIPLRGTQPRSIKKKSRTIIMSGVSFQYLEMSYGAFVLVALVEVAGGVVVEGVDSSLLQPVNIALKAIPNSTTKDSFFIGRRNFSCFPKKHK